MSHPTLSGGLWTAAPIVTWRTHPMCQVSSPLSPTTQIRDLSPVLEDSKLSLPRSRWAQPAWESGGTPRVRFRRERRQRRVRPGHVAPCTALQREGISGLGKRTGKRLKWVGSSCVYGLGSAEASLQHPLILSLEK